MSSFFDKLNLRPNERRLVIIVAILVFIILNAIFVWPKFGEWGRLQKRQRDAEALLRTYQAEVDRTSIYEKQLADLKEKGVAVASEDQALKLATTVQQQAALSGVENRGYTSPRQVPGGNAAKPNQFFDETTGTMTIAGEEKNIVDFLYNLGMGGSLIRVRTMTLNPDPPRQRLQGNMTFVASYAKKALPKVTPTAAPPKTNAPPPSTAANAHSTNAASRSSSLFGSKTNGKK